MKKDTVMYKKKKERGEGGIWKKRKTLGKIGETVWRT